jgi:hypothetical protein
MREMSGVEPHRPQVVRPRARSLFLKPRSPFSVRGLGRVVVCGSIDARVVPHLLPTRGITCIIGRSYLLKAPCSTSWFFILYRFSLQVAYSITR